MAQTTITVKSLVYISTASIKNPVQISTLLFTVYLSILPIIGQTPGSTQKIPKPEPIVVTVSAQHLPLNKLSASVSIISRSEIENSQATTIVEILQHTPFVYLSRIGGRGGLSTASIRGGDANFTLIMINGIPLNDPNNILGGAFDLEALSLDRVNRIEIVRGPMSVRHGSEAIAGIINIITEKGEGKPKCLSKSRAASLRASGGKKAIAAAVRRKRKKDKNPERRGKAINVSNKRKKK